MGTDKAFVPIEGVAMVRRVADALVAAGASDVICVGGDRAGLDRLGLGSIDDEWPGEGPLGGLATALAWATAATVVVAGCDQPWLTAAAITALVAAHRRAAATVTVYGVEGALQPLPGVYDVGLRPDLAAAMARGERALGTAARLVTPNVVEAEDVEALRDVDQPRDMPSA